jgi:hypothetical protein
MDDRQRQRLLHIAAMLCALPLFLAPLAGRSAFEAREAHTVLIERLKADSNLLQPDSPVRVLRDPFVSNTAQPIALSESIGAAPRGGVVGMHVTQGTPIGIAAPAAPAVRAIVAGLDPRALVEVRGRVSIVGIGDEIDGSRVVRITANAIVLRNGTSLFVSGRER